VNGRGGFLLSSRNSGIAPLRSTPVMSAKLPWYLARDFGSLGQFFSA